MDCALAATDIVLNVFLKYIKYAHLGVIFVEGYTFMRNQLFYYCLFLSLSDIVFDLGYRLSRWYHKEYSLLRANCTQPVSRQVRI